MAREAIATLMRAAVVTMLTEYAADGFPPEKRVRLQIYPARPRSIFPPTAFIDGMRETVNYTALTQRQPVADVIVLHGLFDSKEAVDQRDAFVDGFLDWSLDRNTSAVPGSVLGIVEVEDIPAYVPDWLPPEQQKTYYATRIAVEGLHLTG